MPRPVAEVNIEGLTAFRRDLRRLYPEINKQLNRDLKVAAGPILAAAKSKAPYRSGRLAGSIRVSSQQRGVSIRSALPYANVIHWGGSTGRGHREGVAWSGSVKIAPSYFLTDAVRDKERYIVDKMGDMIEHAALRTGWHR